MKSPLTLCLWSLLTTSVLLGQQNILLLDDFELFPLNGLKNSTSVFETTTADVLIQVATDSNAYGYQGKSLQLSYDLSQDSLDFGGYVSLLSSADLRSYNYLSFWIKGVEEYAYPYIELKRANGESAKVALWNYLLCGPTTSWQKVVIPLDAFWNLSELSEITEFVFVIDHYSSQANNALLKGELLLDNILFGSHFLGYVKLDPFNDLLQTNATGGNNGAFSQSGSTTNYQNTIICPVPGDCDCHNRLIYDNTQEDEFGGAFYVLGGGLDGFTTQEKDLSRYSSLYLKVRAEGSQTNPGSFKIELKSDGTKTDTIEEISTSWKSYSIPFQDFRPMFSPDQVSEMTIVFEKNKHLRAKGSVLIDNIAFHSSSFMGEDLTKPEAPVVLSVDGHPPGDQICLDDDAAYITIANIAAGQDRLESIYLQFLDEGVWKHLTTIHAPFSSTSVSIPFETTSLPSDQVEFRVTAENFNGQQQSSSIFQVSIQAFPTLLVELSNTSPSICPGDDLSLTASLNIQVTAPSYSWYHNGKKVEGNDQPTLLLFAPNAGDQIYCKVSSSEVCVFNNPAISATATVSHKLLPEPTLEDMEAICELSAPLSLSNGNPPGGIYFGAGVSNGFFDPAVVGPGQHSITYEYTDPATGCTNEASNEIRVIPAKAFTIEISADRMEICPGETVHFQAKTSSNFDHPPAYQWQINNVNKGNNSPNFSTDQLQEGDEVRCRLITNGECTANAAVHSSSLTIQIHALPEINVDGSLQTCALEEPVELPAVTPEGGLFIGPGINNGTFDPAQAGIGEHTITYQFTEPVTGCSNESSFAAVVSTPETLAVNISASAKTVCEGEIVTVTAHTLGTMEGLSYQWRVNGQLSEETSSTYSFVPAHEDAVRCRVRTAATCIEENPVNSNVIRIELYEQPDPGFDLPDTISIPDTVNLNDYVTLLGGVFLDPQGQQIELLESMIYGEGELELRYQYDYGEGCKATFLDTIYLKDTVDTAADDFPLSTSLRLYPNPSHGRLFLKTSGIAGRVLIHVFDANGQIVYTTSLEALRSGMPREIGLSGLPSGLYFIRITAEDKVHTRKMVYHQ